RRRTAAAVTTGVCRRRRDFGWIDGVHADPQQWTARPACWPVRAADQQPDHANLAAGSADREPVEDLPKHATKHGAVAKPRVGAG
ncbi:hypothetical protein ABTN69_19460, partial [Acinetobacter baumannii]